VDITRKNQNDGVINLTVTDGRSKIRIIEIEMELTEFALALTGRSDCAATITKPPSTVVLQHLGKTKETKRIHVNWNRFSGTKKQLEKLIAPELVNGWTVWSNGIRSQQNGSGHVVILCRYVE
ncbi:MAG: hypothetical protein V3R41_06380, partial [Gammaproteobacteria bacterium]